MFYVSDGTCDNESYDMDPNIPFSVKNSLTKKKKLFIRHPISFYFNLIVIQLTLIYFMEMHLKNNNYNINRLIKWFYYRRLLFKSIHKLYT